MTAPIRGLPWLRLWTDFADDGKVQLLAFEDQRHYVVVLCLKGDGTLDTAFSSDELRERVIARRLGLASAAAAEAKRRLIEVELIDDRWQPLAWDRRQPASDHSGAERKRRERARKRGHKTVTGLSRDRPGLEGEGEGEVEQQNPLISVGDLSPTLRDRRVRKPAKNRSAELRALVAGATKRVTP